QLIAHVGDDGAGQPDGEVFTEAFSDGQVEGSVGGQVVGAIAVQESRAVVQREGREAVPREVSLYACRQRVALVVVQVEAALRRRRKVGQAPCDAAEALSLLVRIYEMSAIVAEHQRRANSDFDPTDARRIDGQRQEDV